MIFECRQCHQTIKPDWRFCENCGKKLPFKTNQKRLATAAQLAEFQRRDREKYQKDGGKILKGATLYATPNACDICAGFHLSVFNIDEIPYLPHAGCECDYGCGCCLISIVKTKDEMILERYGANPTEADKKAIQAATELARQSLEAMRKAFQK